MFHKFFSRFAAFAMVTLASVGASANDGSNGAVTLTADSYILWANALGSNNVIRMVVKNGDYYNAAGKTSAGAWVCTDVDSYMVSSTLPADARQRIYSTLLAAKLAGKAVRLYVDSNTCEDKRPKVYQVTVD